MIRGRIVGAPLALLAEQARVPLWLRKMPTKMLVAPLPVLPDSARFARHRIVNHFPKAVAGKWLQMQVLTPDSLVVRPLEERIRAAAWRAMWRPYRLAMRAVPPWLPLAPDGDALDAF